MRWPLRRQILLPMVGILLLTIAVVSALNAALATARVQKQLQGQLADVSRTMAATNIPLTPGVLQQTRGLTGAEFVATTADGQLAAASDELLVPAATRGGPRPARLDVSSVAAVNGRTYIHAAVPLDRRAAGGGQFLLHVFYPEALWREARWQAVWPPLAIGAAAIALVGLASFFVARHVTQPIERLRSQVGEIAEGHFAPVVLPQRDDELHDLAAAINRMAAQLVKYEEGTRQSERLRTLGTLGGGIAHQIRNAATGCRIALDLHQRDCPLAVSNGHADEPLAVAVRQLGLIETHLQRLLTLGRPQTAEKRETNLGEVVQQALELVRPTAMHLGVELQFNPAEEPPSVNGDAAALVQLLVNLLVNGVQAAAQASAEAAPGSSPVAVSVRLSHTAECCELAVVDPGAGPSPLIQPRLFEPFATDKPGGTGLGLAVVRQIAQDHGGSIRFERHSGTTWFIVDLPKSTVGKALCGVPQTAHT